jgi:hypothetical protein
MKRRSIFAVFITLVSLVAVASPAAAAEGGKAKPIFVDQFNDTFEDEYFAMDISSMCGIDASVTVNAKGRVRVYQADESGFSVEGHVSVRSTIVNEATGDTVISFYSDNFSEAGMTTTEGGFSAELNQRGLYNQFRSPGLGVIAREAGQITFTFEEFFDPETGEFSFNETVDFKGPHPLVESMGDENLAAICSALGGSLQPGGPGGPGGPEE